MAQAARSFSWASALRARHIALPPEHGAWVFLFSPLVIGLALGGVRLPSLLLVIGLVAAFLSRQPLAMVVKALSGRRSKDELPAAGLWLAIYATVGLAAVASLALLGHGYLLWLGIPALAVFAWHLWLVSRRAERRQMLVEIVASGVLALSAPAAYWTGRQAADPGGWLLWGLAWLQVAGTILYAYLRLEQRTLKQMPTLRESLAMARPAFIYNLAAFALVVVLAGARVTPPWLPLAYLLQPLEVAWGVLRPAVGVKPKAIGIRQLIVSSLFTALFVVTWLVP